MAAFPCRHDQTVLLLAQLDSAIIKPHKRHIDMLNGKFLYILCFALDIIIITQRLLMFYLSIFVFCLWILRTRFFPSLQKKKKKRGISIAGLFLWQTPPFDPGNKNQLFFVMWIVAWNSPPPQTPSLLVFMKWICIILFYWNYDESFFFFFFFLMGGEFFVRQTAKSQRKRVAHWQKSELLICVFFLYVNLHYL